MPILLYPLSWALGSMGLSLTFTGAASGMAAISAWAVTTSSGVILIGAGTALKAFAIGGLGALATLFG